MKGVETLVITILLILSLQGSVFIRQSLPDPFYEGYVYDEVGLLDSNTKNTIISPVKKLDQATKTQIVVTVARDLQGFPIEDYSQELFQKRKVGNRQDQGVLLLVAFDGHKIRIKTGYGLEGALPDMVCKRVISEVTPYFQNQNYNGGILKAHIYIFSKVSDEAGFDKDSVQNLNQKNLNTKVEEGKSNGISASFRIIFILIILIVFFSDPRGRQKRRFRGSISFPGGNWSGGGFGGSSGDGWSSDGGGGWSGGGRSLGGNGGWFGDRGFSGGGGASGGR